MIELLSPMAQREQNKARVIELKGIIGTEIAQLHERLGTVKLLENIRDNVWGEGEISEETYFDHKINRDFTPRDYKDLSIGFGLYVDNIPMLTAKYIRPITGKRWSNGVACMGGVRGVGYHSVYGNYELARADLESDSFCMLVVAVPIFKNGSFGYEPPTENPSGYELYVQDFKVPTGKRIPRSALGLVNRKYLGSEKYYVTDTRYPFGIPKPRKVWIGIEDNFGFVINTNEPDVEEKFKLALKNVVNLRRRRNGLPSQMRERGRQIIESMPTELQIKGTATRDELIAWSQRK